MQPYSDPIIPLSIIMRLQAITASTPAFLVCAGGCLLLVGVPLVAYFIMKASEQT
jgi:hypothetical protein